jgi:hypothetical protein
LSLVLGRGLAHCCEPEGATRAKSSIRQASCRRGLSICKAAGSFFTEALTDAAMAEARMLRWREPEHSQCLHWKSLDQGQPTCVNLRGLHCSQVLSKLHCECTLLDFPAHEAFAEGQRWIWRCLSCELARVQCFQRKGSEACHSPLTQCWVYEADSRLAQTTHLWQIHPARH